MTKLKDYLVSIKKLEEEQKRYSQLVEYFIDNNSNLLVNFCEGEVFLPSFMVLKKLKNKYSKLCVIDNELNNLFDMVIHCSKIFYLKSIKLVKRDSIKFNYNYERKFEKKVQPIGQRLINLLANIKYRIKVVRSRNYKLKNSEQNIIFFFVRKLSSPICTAINQLKYKITLKTSSSPSMMRGFYYMMILTVIMMFWMYDYFVLDDIPLMQSMFLCIIFGVVVVLIAIASYPMGDFGKKDISGKNIVAYKYKVLLNNINNTKLVKVFTLQNSNNIDKVKLSVLDK